jgi:hypothetical protein
MLFIYISINNILKVKLKVMDQNKTKDKPKRKYTRKINSEVKIENVMTNKPEIKKRGRKRGRKKKEQDLMLKPEVILDYMIKSFPSMKIEKIKDKVISGLMLKRNLDNDPYILDKIIHDGIPYYYDIKNAVYDIEGQIVGYLIDQTGGIKKLYMIKSSNEDDRSFDEVVNDIKCKNKFLNLQ